MSVAGGDLKRCGNSRGSRNDDHPAIIAKLLRLATLNSNGGGKYSSCEVAVTRCNKRSLQHATDLPRRIWRPLQCQLRLFVTRNHLF